MEPLASNRLLSAANAAIASRTSSDAPDAVSRFDAIYRTYSPLLRRIAIRKFGIPLSDVDGLVHDVFATYLANPANVRDLHPYLIGAICNASRQYRRRDDTERALFCASVNCEAIPETETIDEVVRNLIIGSTLSRMGARCRETLERFYLRGETTIAIARERDTSSNYISRLLNYCRNRARAIYRRISEGS